MKKIIFLVVSAVLCFMVSEIRGTIKEKENKPVIEVPQIEGYVFDQAIFTEEEVNERIKKILGNRITDLSVSFEEGGIVEVNLSVDEKLNELIDSKNNTFLKEAVKLFEGEKISCCIQIKENVDLSLLQCTAANMTIPNSLLDGIFSVISQKAVEILEKAGIESIHVEDRQLRVRGELQQVMGYLNE